MKNNIIYLALSIIIATLIIAFLAFLSNYFGKIAVFEPVNLHLTGISAGNPEDIKVSGLTPEGKVSPFKYNRSRNAYCSYYGFLAAIKISVPSMLSDSIQTITIFSGREAFKYNRKDIDTAWTRTNLPGGKLIELKTPASFKTKETKVRMIVSAKNWALSEVLLYSLLVFTGFVFLFILLRRFIKK